MVAHKEHLFLLFLLSVLVAACGGSPIQTTAPGISNPQSNKLVIIVQGINSNLGTQNVAGNNGYGDTGFGIIESSLKQTAEFSKAQYMTYSYLQTFGLDGQPTAYDCNLTFSQNIAIDESKLAAQITQYTTNHKDTQVYIVAHSLGGVIAFAFLADLVETSQSLIISNGGTLKGIAIMDSPLGGVTDDSTYYTSVWGLAHLPPLASGCNPLHMGEESYTDLTKLFASSPDPLSLGIRASIYQIILGTTVQPKSYISNQDVATQAADLGVRMLIVGNTNDMLWNPDLCDSSIPNLLSTEFLSELGERNNAGALYVRSFQSGNTNCSAVLQDGANHADVLSNGKVGTAIWETFTRKAVDVLIPVINQTTFAPSPTPPTPGLPPTPAPPTSVSPSSTSTPTPKPTIVPSTPTPKPTPIPPTPTSRPTPIPPTPTATPIPPTPTSAPTQSPAPAQLTGYVWPNGKLDQKSSVTLNVAIDTPLNGGGYTLSGTIDISAPLSISRPFTGTIDASGNLIFSFTSGGDTWQFDSGTSMYQDGEWSSEAGSYYINGDYAGSFSL